MNVQVGQNHQRQNMNSLLDIIFKVGKKSLCKSSVYSFQGADVNAAPVPSSKDTALTIAADKGHYKFVELILMHGAYVDVKNKKGNSPLWLAANGKT